MRARPLTLLSCWWMSCFSSEAFSGGSDMLERARRRAAASVRFRRRGLPRSVGRAEHGAGATAGLAQLRGGRGGSAASSPGREGGEAAAVAAPNCCLQTAADSQASGVSPALPDHLQRPLPPPQGPHAATSTQPNAFALRASPHTPYAPIAPFLTLLFCPPDRQVDAPAPQHPAPRASKDPVLLAPPSSRRAVLQRLAGEPGVRC